MYVHPYDDFSVVPLSKKKVSRSKKELEALVVEQGLLPADTNPASFTKQQLMTLLGEENTAEQPTNFSTVKINGYRLSPVALTSVNADLIVADGSSNSLWRLKTSTMNNTVHVEESSVLCSVPTAARSISASSNSIYITTSTGLHVYENDELKLMKKDSDFYGVAANDSQVVVSSNNGLVYKVHMGELQVLSGMEQLGDSIQSMDGFSRTAYHAQPGPICLEQNSVVVCDVASLSIRIITSIQPLLEYHGIISNLYQAFAVHSDNIGFRTVLSTSAIVDKMTSVCNYLDCMVAGVREVTGNAFLKPNRPQGCVPYTTVNMMHSLLNSAKSVGEFVADTDYKVHPAALLSSPCEHHFATMRSRYPMPTLLQYCDHLDVVIAEQVKRATVSSYRYFTAKESYYPNPDFQQLELTDGYLTVQQRLHSKAAVLSAQDRRLMLNWRTDFCAGEV